MLLVDGNGQACVCFGSAHCCMCDWKIQKDGVNVEIVAVAHRNLESPVALGFSHSNVPVFRQATDASQAAG